MDTASPNKVLRENKSVMNHRPSITNVKKQEKRYMNYEDSGIIRYKHDM